MLKRKLEDDQLLLTLGKRPAKEWDTHFSSDRLPAVAWDKIWAYVAESHGNLEAVWKASYVCKSWREAALGYIARLNRTGAIPQHVRDELTTMASRRYAHWSTLAPYPGGGVCNRVNYLRKTSQSIRFITNLERLGASHRVCAFFLDQMNADAVVEPLGHGLMAWLRCPARTAFTEQKGWGYDHTFDC